MAIDKPKFYSEIRTSLFGGVLNSGQVDGMESILNEWIKRNFPDVRWLAYILATVYHETGKKMQPVKEFGGEAYLKTKKYYPYYGRDLVQTTWLYNYEKVKKFTGVDVVTYPDLIANLPVASATAIEFMNKGWYTGKKLSDYINSGKKDYINSRRIINGTDKAKLIASYAEKFEKALN